MKKWTMLGFLLSLSAFSTAHINLTRGSSTTILPGQEDIVVTCSGPTLAPCEIKVDSSNFKLFYIMQNGMRISHSYQEEGIKRLILDFKSLGICL